MIVTKQRKSLQPSSPYTRAQKYRYTDDDQSCLLRNYRPEADTVPVNLMNRQRHSVSTVSPIGKNNQKLFNSYSKKTDKKYDYSLNLDNSYDKEQLNSTHTNVNEKFNYIPENKGQTYKVDFILEEYDRRRANSVTQSSSKYNYTDAKKEPIIRPSQPNSRKNSSAVQQKIDIKSYIKNYEPKYQSTSKYEQKRVNLTSNKENDPLIRKPLMNQNFMDDNFGATDKFKEFKTQSKVNPCEETRNKPKYEPKYAGMRNNKRYEITKQDPQNLREEKSSKNQEYKQNKLSQKPIDFEKLLKDSHSQNSKIVQKINRIQKLNQEINKRLESMMHRKQIS